MIIMMGEERMKGAAKGLRMVLRGLGVELKHTVCLDLAARLCGFDGNRDIDGELSEEDFAARDAFQVGVLEAAGLGARARAPGPGEPNGPLEQNADRGAFPRRLFRQRPLY